MKNTIVKNKGVIIFYLLIIAASFVLTARLKNLNENQPNSQKIIATAK